MENNENPSNDSITAIDRVVNNENANDNGVTCPICLFSLDSDEVQKLSCDHTFHRTCVQHWFEAFQKAVPRCPICRKEATLHEFNNYEERTRVRRNEPDEEDFDNIDINLNDLFGVFETETGENVMIYESPLGIVMIQTVNVPAGLRVISLPNPLHRENPFGYRPQLSTARSRLLNVLQTRRAQRRAQRRMQLITLSIRIQRRINRTKAKIKQFMTKVRNKFSFRRHSR